MLNILSSVHIRAIFNLLSKEIQDCLVFTLLGSVIGPENKLVPLSQPIRCKNKINHDLVARVFPRFFEFIDT